MVFVEASFPSTVSKEFFYIVPVPWQAFLMPRSLARFAERNRWHGRPPVVNMAMSTGLASNCLRCGPVQGLNDNLTHFSFDRFNPYEWTYVADYGIAE